MMATLMNTAQLYLVNKDIDANEFDCQNYLEPSGFSFQRHHCWHICNQDFSESDKTIQSLDFFESFIRQKIFAKYIRQVKVGSGSG